MSDKKIKLHKIEIKIKVMDEHGYIPEEKSNS